MQSTQVRIGGLERSLQNIWNNFVRTPVPLLSKRMFSHLIVEQAGTGTEEMLRVCYEGLRQAELKHCGKLLPEDVHDFCYNVDEDYSFQEGNAMKLFLT